MTVNIITASAILLAEAGCSVVCVDMQLGLAEHTVDMIHRDGLGKGLAVKGNVTDEEDCKTAVEAAVRVFGRLDILVNVVGIGGATGTAVEVDMDDWARSMDVNVGSMVSVDERICW